MPLEDPRRQKKSPPGFRTRHAPCSMDWKCASSRAKWRTVMQMTTSAHASSKDICSTASTEKFDPASADALHRLHVWVNRDSRTHAAYARSPQEANRLCRVTGGRAMSVTVTNSTEWS